MVNRLIAYVQIYFRKLFEFSRRFPSGHILKKYDLQKPKMRQWALNKVVSYIDMAETSLVGSSKSAYRMQLHVWHLPSFSIKRMITRPPLRYTCYWMPHLSFHLNMSFVCFIKYGTFSRVFCSDAIKKRVILRVHCVFVCFKCSQRLST